MRIYNDCYKVVRRKCFNFIKSQETSKEKFKNKERMIKKFLIPVSFWISKKSKSKPYLIGLAGGQGTGKTTISSILKIILINYFKLKVFKISIDDFYKTRKDRINLSKRIHPMLLTRGAPGTHDIKMMLDFFKNSKKSKFKKMKLPLFDKSIDDRLPKKKWYEIKKRPDVIILEGWCVGAKAQKNRAAVTCTGAKPYKQKGSGRARAGSKASPLWRSGGVTFAQRGVRDYGQKINKKMKLLSKFDSNFFSNNHSIDQLILEYLDGQIWFSEISKTNGRFEFLSIINSLDDNNFFLDKSKIEYTIITRSGGFQQKGCKSPIN